MNTQELSMFNLKHLLTVLVCSFCCWANSASAAVWEITYPRATYDNDKRYVYPLTVLKMALDKTGVRYRIMQSERRLEKSQSFRMLGENRSINVVWGVTNRQLETDYLPIRIPIARGLIGWRVFIIKRDDEQRFEAINNLRELQMLSPIQGLEWPDTKILQANGFGVTTVTGYTDAYVALERGLGDFFPRSVIEVSNELKALGKNSPMGLEQHLMMQYPTALYFFVNKADVILAQLIEAGLNKAIESGEYHALFLKTFGPIIESLNLADRQKFLLANPLMTSDMPVHGGKLWFRLEELE